MINTTFILTGVGSVCLGFILFRVLLAILPARLAAQSRKQAIEVVNEAQRQNKSIGKSKSIKLDGELDIAREELESEIVQTKADLADQEQILEDRKKQVTREGSQIEKLETRVNSAKRRVETVLGNLKARMIVWRTARRH